MDSSLDIQMWINKIGVGTTYVKNGITYYQQGYIRTLQTLALVLVCAYAPELIPVIVGAGGELAYI